MNTIGMKRLLSIMLVFVMVMSLLVSVAPVEAYATESVDHIVINKIGNQAEAFMKGTYSSDVAKNIQSNCFKITTNVMYEMSRSNEPSMYLVTPDGEKTYLNENSSFDAVGEYWLELIVDVKEGYSFANDTTVELNRGDRPDNEIRVDYVQPTMFARVGVLVKTVEPSFDVIEEIDIAINPDFIAGLESGTFDEDAAYPFVLGEASKDANGDIYEFYEFYEDVTYAIFDNEGLIEDGDTVDLSKTYYVQAVLGIVDQGGNYRFANTMTAKSGDENFTIEIAQASGTDENVNYNFFANVTYIIEPEVDSFKVQFDWNKVPLLEKGMTMDNLPEFDDSNMPATVEGVELDNVGWAIEVNESFYLTKEQEDKIIEALGKEEGEELIDNYNSYIEDGIEMFNGWMPLEVILSLGEITGYTINDKDTYSVFLYLEAEDGMSFAGPNEDGEFSGKIESNVEVGASAYSLDGLVVFFKLGTLADMEEEKYDAMLDIDVDVNAEAPIKDVTLDNSAKELLEGGKIFTDAEKALIEGGEQSKVWLEVGKTNLNTIAKEDKAKLEEAAKKAVGDDAKILYFNADLYKQVGNNNPESVAEPGVEIEITFAMPTELLNNDKNVERTYKILRLHDGKVDVIDGEFNAETGEFTFKTDKFSTYAIVYKDVSKTTTEVPKTGDTNSVLPMMAVMFLAGAAMVVANKKREEEK